MTGDDDKMPAAAAQIGIPRQFGLTPELSVHGSLVPDWVIIMSVDRMAMQQCIAKAFNPVRVDPSALSLAKRLADVVRCGLRLLQCLPVCLPARLPACVPIFSVAVCWQCCCW